MKYVLAFIIISTGWRNSIKAMVAEKGDLIYACSAIARHINYVEGELQRAIYKKQQKIMDEANKLGPLLQKSLLLSLEVKRLNFEESVNKLHVILAEMHADHHNVKKLRVLNERIKMEKEDLVKQKNDLKQQEQKINQQIYAIENKIQQTAHKARMIAIDINHQAKMQKIKSRTYSIETPMRKFKKELQKELASILRPSTIIHPPILLSKPKSTKRIFPRMRFYVATNPAKIALLTACLNAPSIRYDKSFTKRDPINLINKLFN